MKKELEQTKTLKSKLDAKDSDIRELKILVKIKQEEIGELTIRKDIAEKKVANNDAKLANTVRDYEQTVQKLQVCKLTSLFLTFLNFRRSRKRPYRNMENCVIILFSNNSSKNFMFSYLFSA